MKLFVACLSVSFLTMCGATEHSSDGGDGDEHAADANTPQQFEGVGFYLFHETEHDQTTVSINHEEIPGFMDAMAMSFAVENSALVEGLEAGQKIRFRIVVEDGGFYFIDEISRLDAPE